MSVSLTLLPKGKMMACRLVAEHLLLRGREVDSIPPLTNEQVMLVLISYGALQTESRQEAWFRSRLDMILGL